MHDNARFYETEVVLKNIIEANFRLVMFRSLSANCYEFISV